MAKQQFRLFSIHSSISPNFILYDTLITLRPLAQLNNMSSIPSSPVILHTPYQLHALPIVKPQPLQAGASLQHSFHHIIPRFLLLFPHLSPELVPIRAHVRVSAPRRIEANSEGRGVCKDEFFEVFEL